jgi:hypothetical protein
LELAGRNDVASKVMGMAREKGKSVGPKKGQGGSQ